MSISYVDIFYEHPYLVTELLRNVSLTAVNA